MKLKLFALLIVLVILAACSPAFPGIVDTRPPTATPEATATPEPTPVCDIKGNINSDGARIYFTPASINYKNVKITLPGERYFCSEAEAQAAGWRKALK